MANDALPVIVVNNQAEPRVLCTAHAMGAHWIRLSVLVMCRSNTSDTQLITRHIQTHLYIYGFEKQTFKSKDFAQ